MATMAEAVQAALVGPERKKLNIYDHEFNVKPAEQEKTNRRLVVNGHMSHHLAFRPDDQVYYTIVIEDAAIEEITRKISGWAPLAGPVVSAAGAYFGVPIPPDKVEAIGRDLGRAIDGTWEKAAEVIIANIAMAFQQRGLEVSVAEGDLIRSPDDPAVFLVENGQRRWVPNEATFLSRWSWDRVRELPAETVNAIPRGADLPSIV